MRLDEITKGDVDREEAFIPLTTQSFSSQLKYLSGEGLLWLELKYPSAKCIQP